MASPRFPGDARLRHDGGDPPSRQFAAAKKTKRHITQAEPLAAQVEPEALLGDKGYDADSFITSLEVRAIKVVIPPRSTRKVKRACDFALYAERNLVERFFNAIKHYRGIATRYEKTARNFLAGLHLVCALAWLK